MKARAALVLAVGMLLAGCGGDGGSSAGTESAAGIAPATTAAFLSIVSDLHADQVQAVDDVLQKFPVREQVLSALRSTLASAPARRRALLRSVGPEVDVAVLDATAGTAVGFTQPRDKDAFERALKNDPETTWVTADVHGWTAFSDDEDALDEVRDAKDHLDGLQEYRDATAELPDEALAKAYVARSAIAAGTGALGRGVPSLPRQTTNARWVSAAALAHDDGLEVQLHVKGKELARQTTSFESGLADEIPRGVLAAVAFDGLDKSLAQLNAVLSSLPLGVGFPTQLERVAKVLSGEGVVYVRAGNPIPEVTLVAKVDDTARAERAARGIVRSLAPPSASTRELEVDGVKLQSVDLGPVSIFYGAFGGKLVVSDSSNAVHELKEKNDKLADDHVFGDAKDAAGMPDETVGWLYVNVKDTLPVVEGFTQISGQRIPNQLDDNLRPLRSLLVYGSRDGDVLTVKAFLQTS